MPPYDRAQVIDPRDPKFYLCVNRAELCNAKPEQGGPTDPHWSFPLWLIIWDRSNDTVRDIKEQRIMVPREMSPMVLEGWSNAVKKVLETAPELEMMMPRDFLDFTTMVRVSELKTAKTTEDYEKAFLAKSRLGRWLPKEKVPLGPRW